jgi:putative ABC transport system permease protein
MKFLPFIFKHLRHKWGRTLTTVLAMSLCIFLFCTLQGILAAINDLLESTSANRLITRHAVSLVFNVPLSYQSRIASVPGVKRVAISSWFGGSLPAKKEGKAEPGEDEVQSTTDWSNFFNNMAVEAEPFFAMSPEFPVAPDQWRDFMQDLQGCVIGRKLADKYNWKVGDRFYLESFIPPYRKQSGPFEFVVRAITDVDRAKYPSADASIMLFHYKYLYESTGQQVGAGTYTIEIENPNQAGQVSDAVDALFANSAAQTHTETEKAFVAGFMAMAGNLALLLNGIGLAVSFTILVVTANTMSMAVRERRTEIAVLKTLGFTSVGVMALIVAEALMLALLGGLLGVGGSKGIMWTLTHVPGIRDMLAGMGLTSLDLKPVIALLGVAVALALGIAAGFVPAWGAYRAKITDMLRTV